MPSEAVPQPAAVLAVEGTTEVLQIRDGRWDAIPGGEGDDAFRRRVCVAVEQIATRHPEQTVAVVCHGAVINAYLVDILGMHRSHVFSIENTSVTVVPAGPLGRAIVAVNDCHHLYDPVPAGPPAG